MEKNAPKSPDAFKPDGAILSFLPKRLGLFTGAALKPFFSKIRLSDAQVRAVKALPADAVVVYCPSHPSLLEFLFCRIRFQKEKIPHPGLTLGPSVWLVRPVSRLIKAAWRTLAFFRSNRRFFDPFEDGAFKDALLGGMAGFLPLVDARAFHLRFIKNRTDPIRFLMELGKETGRPVYLVPLVLFFSKAPRRAGSRLTDMFFGTREEPGGLRRLLTLARRPKSLFLEMGDPVDVARFVSRPALGRMFMEDRAHVLRSHLLGQTGAIRKSITGPYLKSRAEIREGILTSRPLRDDMAHYAKTRCLSIYETRKKAGQYLDEIASNYSPALVAVASKIVRLILNLMFQGVSINHEMLEKLKALNRTAPLILLPSHKSNIDGLILFDQLYHNNMPFAHVAAGKNMAFFPMGSIFRAGGAFFLRRTFKGMMLYPKVFFSYIYRLLQEGYNIEYFIEGTRSRTGKLLPPKPGLLNILVQAWKEGACPDLIMAPISLGYDRVLEESGFLHELTGGKKEPESFFQVIRARKFLSGRFGKIYIRFHEPISLREHLEGRGLSPDTLTGKDQAKVVSDLGRSITSAMDAACVATPHALTAAAILNDPRTRFSFERLWDNVKTYMDFLQFQGIEFSDTLMMDPKGAVGHVLSDWLNRKFILPIPPVAGDPEEDKEPDHGQFQVNMGRRPDLNYYANTCVSPLISGAVCALSILKKDAFQFCSTDLHDDCAFLTDFLKFEFSFDPDFAVSFRVRKSIKAFMDQAALTPHPAMPDTYTITAAGLRKLRLFAGLVTPFLESYFIVGSYLLKTADTGDDPKDHLKKIMARGNKMFRKEAVERKEALSLMNFKNGLAYFHCLDIKGSADKKRLAFVLDQIRTWRKYAPD